MHVEASVQPSERFEIGLSANGHAIEAVQFGSGPIEIVLVGGIHGGYEWNTVLLAQRMIAYFESRPWVIPESVTLTIVPVLNPDGLLRVVDDIEFSAEDVQAPTAPGRFNGNWVDLNRNWDCQWQPEATWLNQTVSGGTAPFSEPETMALRDFLDARQPVAVVVWHSAGNGVFAAGCGSVWQPSYRLAQFYGRESGYPVHRSFDFYRVTGDVTDWLARIGVPAVTVELERHDTVEWAANQAAVEALLARYNLPLR